MLEAVFKAILNMSISASVAAVLIMLFRGITGKKIPRVFIYTLWSIVLLRLVLPFFLPSVFSIYNVVSIPDVISIRDTQVTQARQYQKGNSQRLDNSRQNTDNAINTIDGFGPDMGNIKGIIAGEKVQNQNNREPAYDGMSDGSYESFGRKAIVDIAEDDALKKNNADSFSENS